MPLVMLTSNSPELRRRADRRRRLPDGSGSRTRRRAIIRDEMGGHADVIILDYPDLDYLVTRANGLEDGVLEFAPEAHDHRALSRRDSGQRPEVGQQADR